MNDIQLAKFLGYFSLVLGALELTAPRYFVRKLGLARSAAFVRGFGAREVAAGITVLTYPDSPAPLLARVAGDVLDLGVLASAVRRPGNRRRGAAGVAAANVLAITAADALCAIALARRRARANETARRTRVALPFDTTAAGSK